MTQETWVRKDQPDHRASRGNKAQPALLGRRERLVLLAQWDRKVRRGRMAPRGWMELTDRMGLLVLWVQKARLVFKDLRESLARRVNRAFPGSKAQSVPPALSDPVALKETRGTQVHRAHKVQ